MTQQSPVAKRFVEQHVSITTWLHGHMISQRHWYQAGHSSVEHRRMALCGMAAGTCASPLHCYGNDVDER